MVFPAPYTIILKIWNSLSSGIIGQSGSLFHHNLKLPPTSEVVILPLYYMFAMVGMFLEFIYISRVSFSRNMERSPILAFLEVELVLWFAWNVRSLSLPSRAISLLPHDSLSSLCHNKLWIPVDDHKIRMSLLSRILINNRTNQSPSPSGWAHSVSQK